MQFNILWTGREYYSLENCLVDTSEAGVDVHSVIVGKYEGQIYRVDYRVKANPGWEVQLVQVSCRHGNREQLYRLQGDGNGRWNINNEPAPEFEGCLYPDIAVTPFTNTLPINRLRMTEGATEEICVIYFDLLNHNIRPVNQLYKRLDESTYHYENIPNDFEADIVVDKHGFVVDYPLLFSRTLILPSGYCHHKQDI